MNDIFLFLYNSVKEFPDNIFVIDKGKRWTYSEIYKRVIFLANHLSCCNINSGDRVMIYLDNSYEYITAFYAGLLMNGVIVPVNKNTSLENIKFIIDETKPKAIVSNSLYLKKIEGSIHTESVKTVVTDMLFNNTDDYTGDKYEFNEITAELLDGNQLALILYTSGTTKTPKGVMLTHENLNVNTDSILEYLRLTSEDSVLVTIPFSYSYGNSLLLTHTKVGGCLNIENRVSYPIKVLEQLESGSVTGFSTVGSYLNILLKQEYIWNIHFDKLRYMTFAGESTSYEDITALNKIAPHLSIYIMYGQTEAGARLSYLEPEMFFEKRGSIGKGIAKVKLRVISEDGHDIKPGEIGEIIAYGDNIMKGYWNNEEETKLVIKDGWLYTGDLATVDDDGYIYIKGRKNDIIKHLGHRISPSEIESAINTCEGVLESAVVEVQNNSGKQIKAYIVAKDNNCTEELIDLHIRKILPAYKRPHLIEFIDIIPRTLNGKIKRSELREKNTHTFNLE